ncbi:MAG: hypothetical protein A2744_01495 [Candidatus Buchananbacteria bacterium RIFCSPHIGHO2_01_FULL_44_11]|uniref:Amidohydrolase-related domain-containing protein n=1 Tax=Candidatus Buchananbacteria bacterium RIFCSPHIGHO2_01_FULL_44_11 TaxID=1797535 RepID=A0A1G1XZG8_9BACT|nr:MAG: hypothetical protein A2744_01495 [Candidatus Buchananbacteria bacterium RIFCSPHIGHO2_01_FULL_44_11]
MIIDSHLHISYLKKKKSFTLIRRNLLSLMDRNKVNYAIVIPDNVPNPQCAGLDDVNELVKNEKRLFMMATLLVNEVNNENLAKIENMFRKKLAVGFKIFPGHDPVYPTDHRWLPIVDLCQKYKIPFVIHTGINSGRPDVAEYNDPKHIRSLALKFPKLKIVIAHYFWPRLDYGFKLTELLPNIYFDTSALADPEVVRESGGLKKIRDILVKTIKRKSDSVIYGTDWPICSFTKHINLINSLPISAKAKQDIFFRNSLKLFPLEK